MKIWKIFLHDLKIYILQKTHCVNQARTTKIKLMFSHIDKVATNLHYQFEK